MRCNKNAGFTIVEIVTVIVIIGIMAGVVASNYNNYRATAQIRAAEHVIEYIDKARVTSMTSNYPVDMVLKYDDSHLIAMITVRGSESILDQETFVVCDKEYILQYIVGENVVFDNLEKGESISFHFNKSTSGFDGSDYIRQIRFSNNDDTLIQFVKETGRAYKVNGV